MIFMPLPTLIRLMLLLMRLIYALVADADYLRARRDVAM